jgi:5-formyltetrahydrofolate cyclo-ligase
LSPGQGGERGADSKKEEEGGGDEDATAADVTVAARKSQIRADALRIRKTIPPDTLRALSSRVEANLLSLREYQDAHLLISYCAKADEVQTRSIIEGALAAGKRVAVVVTDVPSKTLSFSEIMSFDEELAPGPFGILEPRRGLLRPVSLSQADLVLMPLVAWDMAGGRLGYGVGYFDRALAGTLDGRPTKVGLALESQRADQIPISTHDVALDLIVTEERVVRPATVGERGGKKGSSERKKGAGEREDRR